jgi:hypothetical protein
MVGIPSSRRIFCGDWLSTTDWNLWSYAEVALLKLSEPAKTGLLNTDDGSSTVPKERGRVLSPLEVGNEARHPLCSLDQCTNGPSSQPAGYTPVASQ